MKRTLVLSTTALSLLAAPALAGSAGCGSNCELQAELDALRAEVADLARKVEAGSADKKKFVQSGGTGIELKLSGQVNRGVLITDDGDSTEEFFVDNDASSTRFRLTGSGAINPDTKMGVNIEVQMESNSTNSVSQLNKTTGGTSFTERKLEWYLDSKTLGRLSVGQGDTASNSTSQIDLSGTSVAIYSNVKVFAGSILFFDDNLNALSGVDIGDRFDNLDGLSRRDRVRYDSPKIAGFTASGSVADSGRWDGALRYAGEFGDLAVKAGAAYSNDQNDEDVINGSASILHKTSGLSLTVAAGERQDGNEEGFYYAKVGWQTKGLTSLGKTSFAIDYYKGEDVGVIGSDSEAFGAAIVQKIDRVGTEFYLAARNYDVDEPGADFDNIFAVLAGARVKF